MNIAPIFLGGPLTTIPLSFQLAHLIYGNCLLSATVVGFALHNFACAGGKAAVLLLKQAGIQSAAPR